MRHAARPAAPVPSSASAPTALRVVHVDPRDDYRLLVRLALQSHPGLLLAGQAPTLADGTEVACRERPDVLLVEPFTRAVADLDGLGRLADAAPRSRVVLLTSLPAGEMGNPLPHGRAIGRLSKRLPPTELADELRALLTVLDVVDRATEKEVGTRLEPELISPRRAREFVVQTLEQWRCADPASMIELLVSEAVANAVMHAGTPADLSVRLLPDRVRVSLSDADLSHPKRRATDPTVSSGRGLALIEQLSLAWGIDRLPDGKRVWFETPRPGIPPRSPAS